MHARTEIQLGEQSRVVTAALGCERGERRRPVWGEVVAQADVADRVAVKDGGALPQGGVFEGELPDGLLVQGQGAAQVGLWRRPG